MPPSASRSVARTVCSALSKRAPSTAATGTAQRSSAIRRGRRAGGGRAPRRAVTSANPCARVGARSCSQVKAWGLRTSLARPGTYSAPEVRHPPWARTCPPPIAPRGMPRARGIRARRQKSAGASPASGGGSGKSRRTASTRPEPESWRRRRSPRPPGAGGPRSPSRSGEQPPPRRGGRRRPRARRAKARPLYPRGWRPGARTAPPPPPPRAEGRSGRRGRRRRRTVRPARQGPPRARSGPPPGSDPPGAADGPARAPATPPPPP